MSIGAKLEIWVSLTDNNRVRLRRWITGISGTLLLILIATTSPAQAAGNVNQTVVNTGYWFPYGWVLNNISSAYGSANEACEGVRKSQYAVSPWWDTWNNVFVGTEPNASYYASMGMVNCLFQNPVTGVIAPFNGVYPVRKSDCPDNSSDVVTKGVCICNDNFNPDLTRTSCVPVVTCPDKIAELTDPVALLYENGTYSATKPDLDHLTPATQSGISCIKQKVAALNCYMTPKPTSGYRPTAYQKHILDVYDQWQKIKDNEDPICAANKAAIYAEWLIHEPFARRPAVTSNHSQLDAQGKPAGNAVDISFVPDDANISADSIACQCNMYRPLINMPNPKDNDPVHYQPRTCLP